MSTYATGESPQTGDVVSHYVDGDTGTVKAIGATDDNGQTSITVDWQRDGLNDHFADECGLLASGTLTLPDGTKHSGRLQIDENGQPVVDIATCGACGFAWNDELITGITPTPSGRCPNEYGHDHDH